MAQVLLRSTPRGCRRGRASLWWHKLCGGANVAQRSAYLIKDVKIIYADYRGTTDKQAEVILQVIADLEKK